MKSWDTGAPTEFEGAQCKVERSPGDEAEPTITILFMGEE